MLAVLKRPVTVTAPLELYVVAAAMLPLAVALGIVVGWWLHKVSIEWHAPPRVCTAVTVESASFWYGC